MFATFKQVIRPTYTPIENGPALADDIESRVNAQILRTQRLVILSCMAAVTSCFCRLSFTAAGAVSIYLASKSPLSDEAKIGVYVVGGLAMLGGCCINPSGSNAKHETRPAASPDVISIGGIGPL